MVARHDLKKRHHGRRKKGSRKRHKMWLQRNKLRYKNPTNRKARRRLGLRRKRWLRRFR